MDNERDAAEIVDIIGVRPSVSELTDDEVEEVFEQIVASIDAEERSPDLKDDPL